MARYDVSSGVTSSGLVLNNDSMYVSNGGTAEKTTVNLGGELVIYSGATVTDVKENGGTVSIQSESFVSFKPNSFTGLVLEESAAATIHSGTTANKTTLNTGGLLVYSGGIANSTTVNKGGYMWIYSGGTVNNAAVNEGGQINILSGGTVTNIAWTPCEGVVRIDPGATVTFASSLSGVYAGSGGKLVSHAAVMESKTIGFGSGYSLTHLVVMNGGVANDITVSSYGYMRICSGGTVNRATIVNQVQVESGGTINSATVDHLNVFTGATAHNIVVKGYMSINGVASNISVNSSGEVEVYGTVKNVVVSSGGSFVIRGTATDFNLDYGTFLYVYLNSKTQISGTSNGKEISIKDGHVSGHSIRRGGLTLCDGCIAVETLVGESTRMFVSSGGTASNTKIYGSMCVRSGGTASDIEAYGNMVVFSGGKLTGQMFFNSNAYVIASDGPELNFDISKLSPGAAARVNNLSLIKGVPLYTLTVSASQAKGVYTLAEGASKFDDTITILNTDGSETGYTLTVGKSVEIGKTEYTLSLSGEKLQLEVGVADKVAPTVSNIKATPTTPTNLTVTVTATFADDVKLAQSLYRIGDDGDWTDYKSGVTVDENTTIYFRAVDEAGNVSAPASYKVTNIDKIPPAAPKATADIVKPSLYPVNVSAEFSGDSVKKEYSLDGKTWKNYSGAINFQENGSVYFRGTDAAGNVSETVCYNVTNILLEEPDPADDGWNDYLYDKKRETPLNDKVYRLAPQVIAKGDEEILLDAPGMIEYGEMHGFIGKSAEYGTIDPADFTKIRLNSAAKLSFLVSVTTAAKFTVWTLVEGTDKKTGATTYTMKSLMSITVKNVHADTSNKPLLLDAGDYYVSLESTNPKKAKEGYHSMRIDETQSEFYTKGDNSDDWTDMKEKGAAGHFGKLGTLSEDGVAVVSGEWVGTGDVVDYRQFKLAKATKLCFLVTSNGPVKFTVWQLNSKTDKKGVTTYSLKSLQSSTLKAPGYTFADPKGLMLDAGTYYFSVESTNAAKGGGADYEVTIAGSVFYTKGDNSDDWTDMKEKGAAGMVGNAGVINASNKKVLSDWVGTGDVIDYKRFKLNSAAKLTFKLDASDAAKFTVWKLNAKTDKKGVTAYSLKSLQATTIKADVTAMTKELLLDAGTYYFSMESTNAKKGADADYTVSTGNCVFYNRGDNSDDWGDMKKYGPDGMVGDVGEIYEDIGTILDDWVGYGDAIDYKKFTLDTDATLSFEVSAGDAAKFTVWRLDAKYSKTQVPNYSLKSLASVKLNGNSATTKAVKLTAGDYYFSMESTNAKKGGDAAYRVSLNMEASEFYYGDDYATGTGVRSAVDMCALPEPESTLALGFAETCAGSATGLLASL